MTINTQVGSTHTKPPVPLAITEKPSPSALPRSAGIVFDAIQDSKRITPKDLIDKTKLTPRTVRFALTYLKRQGYVKRTPNLADMRQSFYSPR